MNVTDAAVEKAVMVRARETDPERYALWVEVVGVQGGEYAYDLSLQPLAEAPADASVTDLGRISLVIPAESVELLRGATLDRQGDLATGGLVIHNRTPPSPAIGVPASADLSDDALNYRGIRPCESRGRVARAFVEHAFRMRPE